MSSSRIFFSLVCGWAGVGFAWLLVLWVHVCVSIAFSFFFLFLLFFFLLVVGGWVGGYGVLERACACGCPCACLSGGFR